MTTPGSDHYVIGAVDKALVLLKCFSSQRGEWTTSALARELNTSKPTILRLAHTLELRGLLVRNAQGCYELGYEVVRLANALLSRQDIRSAAEPYMRQLVQRFDETVYLGAFRGDHVVILRRSDCTNPLKLVLEIGSVMPLDTASLGKVVLSQLSPDEKQSIVGQQPPENQARLLADLECGKERGFAVSLGQRLVGVVGIAVPIIGRDRMVLGGIAISMPEERYNSERLPEYVKALQESAREISAVMGLSDRYPW